MAAGSACLMPAESYPDCTVLLNLHTELAEPRKREKEAGDLAALLLVYWLMSTS